jgi:hypothetical protein
MSNMKEDSSWHSHYTNKFGERIRGLKPKAVRREQALLDFFGNDFGRAETSALMRKNSEHINNPLDKILNQMEKNLNNPARLLEADWSQYLPEPLLSGSRPKFVKPDGTLIIEADNATLMYAMRNYYTRELLMKFRQRFPNEINNILVVTADYKGKK